MLTPRVITALALLPAAAALAQSDTTLTSPGALSLHAQPPAESTPADPAPANAAPAFGSEGSTWWSIGTGAATDLSDSTSFNLHASIGHFIAPDVEVLGELGAWYYAQPGDDAVGINPNFVLRWHFYNKDAWTLYADAGIGLLLASSDVPEGGTSFDFTPRAGLGLTRALDDRGTRLQLGVRWAHVSNARITGNDDNVGLDSVMLYVGVIFPF
jgi:lipid A 3-O-deacylase